MVRVGSPRSLLFAGVAIASIVTLAGCGEQRTPTSPLATSETTGAAPTMSATTSGGTVALSGDATLVPAGATPIDTVRRVTTSVGSRSSAHRPTTSDATSTSTNHRTYPDAVSNR